MVKTGLALAKSHPEQMRDLLAPGIPKYCARLLESLDEKTRSLTNEKGQSYEVNNPMHRTGMDLFPKIFKAIGAPEALMQALLDKLNARDESHLASAMALYQSASGATLDDALETACATIRAAIEAQPHRRARLKEACFGEREVAQEEHSNGAVPRENGTGIALTRRTASRVP